MNLLQSLVVILTGSISISLFSMHHEKIVNFSDCKGEVGNFYVSRILEGGTIEGFQKAVNLHQKFYSSRGFNVQVIPSVQYQREDGEVIEKPYMFSTLVLFPNLKIREEWREREITEQDQEEFNAFIKLYDENNEIIETKAICNLN